MGGDDGEVAEDAARLLEPLGNSQELAGAYAMVAAGSIVLQDVPPFVTASGYPAKPHGTNGEGLRRRGFAASDITAIRRAYKALYRNKLSLDEATKLSDLQSAITAYSALVGSPRAAIGGKTGVDTPAGKVPALGIMAEFLETPGRGIIR